MALLEITDFHKSFGKNEVLKGINLSVEKGEVLSIIGSSGSGKTTLLRCINFLENPDAGVMTLDGEVLIDKSIQKKESDRDIRNKRLNFGLVFQQFNLFPQYTVLGNISLAPMLRLKEQKLLKAEADVERRRIAADAEELLAKVGLLDKKDSYPGELSGGQQQRVAIARALALKPKVLCFDEPTSALDPELTGEVLKVIKSLKDDGRTMIIVTHEMGFARNVSDKVLFLADGIAEEYGTPGDVFDRPKSERLKNFIASIENKENF